jgi:lsr operon transcriptional repressor
MLLRAARARDPETQQDLMVRACWYYYAEDLNQIEIAALLGLSRVKVQRLLQAAKNAGLVEVRIRSALTPCLRLEERLKELYALRIVRVVPVPHDPARLKAQLGRGAAEVLQEITVSLHALAVGWGSTLAEITPHLAGTRAPGLEVVSTVGAITAGSEHHPYEIVHKLGEQLGAKYRYLAAPAFADSARDRDVLLSQEEIRSALQRAQRADALLVGMGEVTITSTLVTLGFLGSDEIRSLRRLGAVGSILLYFYDHAGRIVRSPLHDRIVGLSAAAVRRIPLRLGVAGGSHKVGALRAALQGGWLNGLVTDEATAAALVSGRGTGVSGGAIERV